MTLPQTFYHTAPFDSLDHAVRVLGAMLPEHQAMIAGIAGNVVGVNCSDLEWKKWKAEWDELNDEAVTIE